MAESNWEIIDRHITKQQKEIDELKHQLKWRRNIPIYLVLVLQVIILVWGK